MTNHDGRADIPRINWTQEQIDENPYGYELAKHRALKQWEEQKKAEAEAKERQKKQTDLQAYLNRRAEDWREVTGSEPSVEELRHWKREYMDRRAFEREMERAENIDTSHLPT